MKNILAIAAIMILLAGSVAYAEEKPSPLTAQQATEMLQGGKTVYACPMKMDWLSDKPGECPCCNMQLSEVKEIKDGQAILKSNAGE